MQLASARVKRVLYVTSLVRPMRRRIFAIISISFYSIRFACLLRTDIYWKMWTVARSIRRVATDRSIINSIRTCVSLCVDIHSFIVTHSQIKQSRSENVNHSEIARLWLEMLSQWLIDKNDCGGLLIEVISIIVVFSTVYSVTYTPQTYTHCTDGVVMMSPSPLWPAFGSRHE